MLHATPASTRGAHAAHARPRSQGARLTTKRLQPMRGSHACACTCTCVCCGGAAPAHPDPPTRPTHLRLARLALQQFPLRQQLLACCALPLHAEAVQLLLLLRQQAPAWRWCCGSVRGGRGGLCTCCAWKASDRKEKNHVSLRSTGCMPDSLHHANTAVLACVHGWWCGQRQPEGVAHAVGSRLSTFALAGAWAHAACGCMPTTQLQARRCMQASAWAEARRCAAAPCACSSCRGRCLRIQIHPLPGLLTPRLCSSERGLHPPATPPRAGSGTPARPRAPACG